MADITRQPVTEILRRGLDNAIANWPLLLIRVGETVLLAILTVGAVLVTVVPLIALVASGTAAGNLAPLLAAIRRGQADPAEVEQMGDALIAALIANWWLIIFGLIAVMVLLIVLAAVHSFVIAGVARILVDAEKSGAAAGERRRFARFSIDRWMSGALANWLAVFWIYNIAYGLLLAVVIVPMLLVLALMTLFSGTPAAIVIGCLGILLSLILIVVMSVLASIWSQKAIVIAVARKADARLALSEARLQITRDFGRHAGVALILLVITIGGGGALSMMSLAFSLPGMAAPVFGLAFLPLRIAASLASSVLSAAVSNWLIASFAVLSE